MDPLVSVIIPAYNCVKYIRATIDSVLGQNYKNIEIIVVDDGSTDQTGEQVTPYAGKVKCIRKENGGPASARNVGIKAAQGKYIAFCDSDDLWEAHKLAEQIPLLEADAEVGLVYTDTSNIDQDGRALPSRQRLRPSGKIFMELFMKNSIPNSTVVIRKECLTRTGVFDEDRELISVEDYDLWLRIAAEYKIAYVNKPLVKYRHHTSGISKNISRSYLGEAKVIKNAVIRFGQKFSLDSLLNRRFSQLYFEFGHDHFYLNQIREAQAPLKKSLAYDPFNLRAWQYYLLSWLGPNVIGNLKDFKHKNML